MACFIGNQMLYKYFSWDFNIMLKKSNCSNFLLFIIVWYFIILSYHLWFYKYLFLFLKLIFSLL